MLVSPVERPVASAAYGFVRFIGGGLAPFAAGKLAEHFGLHVPFLVGAVAVGARHRACSSTGHRMLSRADADLAAAGTADRRTTTSPARWPTSSAAPRARSTTSCRSRARPADAGSGPPTQAQALGRFR